MLVTLRDAAAVHERMSESGSSMRNAFFPWRPLVLRNQKLLREVERTNQNLLELYLLLW